MKKKYLVIFILSFVASVFLFLTPSFSAEEAKTNPPAEAQPANPEPVKPEGVTTAPPQITVPPKEISQLMPAQHLNLKQLIEEAQKNIKKVDAELEKQKVFEQNRKKELEARRHFEKGNKLFKQGKLLDAKKEWAQTLDMTQDKDFKGYMRQTLIEADKEEAAKAKRLAEEKKAIEWELRDNKLRQAHRIQDAKERKAQEAALGKKPEAQPAPLAPPTKVKPQPTRTEKLKQQDEKATRQETKAEEIAKKKADAQARKQTELEAKEKARSERKLAEENRKRDELCRRKAAKDKEKGYDWLSKGARAAKIKEDKQLRAADVELSKLEKKLDKDKPKPGLFNFPFLNRLFSGR